MIRVYVPSVGDGLALGLRALDGPTVQIDCGSQKMAKQACAKSNRP
jgi:hypothetical protein